MAAELIGRRRQSAARYLAAVAEGSAPHGGAEYPPAPSAR